MASSIEQLVSRICLPKIPRQEFPVSCASGDDIRPALCAALERASSAGGGRILLPHGSFSCSGPIHLPSRTELHLADGTYLKFTPHPQAYLPLVFTRWEGVELFGLSPMIYANGETDIAITGKGVISSGFEQFAQWRARQTPAQQKVRSFQEQGLPIEKRIMGLEEFLRPSFVQFVNSERILLDGPTFTNTAFWMLHPIYCRHLTFRNLHLDSMMVNNDGIDLDSCEDVLVEDSTFRNGDDAVVVKSGRDYDGLRVNRPTRRVVLRRCVFHEAMHGFAIGSELSGGAEDIFVEDITMKYIWQQAISFKSMEGRGGIIRNIHLNRITVEHAGNHLINLTNDYGTDVHGTDLTLFEHIDISNLDCEFAEKAFGFQGKAECPVGAILLQNIRVRHANALFTPLEYADRIQLRNVEVNGSQVTI